MKNTKTISYSGVFVASRRIAARNWRYQLSCSSALFEAEGEDVEENFNQRHHGAAEEEPKDATSAGQEV